MFSLIVTILSIALVAVLAIATVWYGGQVYTVQQNKAKAVTYSTQASQINAAVQAYKVSHQGASPSDINELVSAGYLQSIPKPPVMAQSFSLISSAYADNDPNWQLVKDSKGNIAFLVVRNQVNADTCRIVQAYASGKESLIDLVTSPSAIPTVIDLSKIYQCIEETPNSVATKYSYFWVTTGLGGSPIDGVSEFNKDNGTSIEVSYGDTSGSVTPMPASLNFGSVALNTTSSPQAVQLKNNGTAPALVTTLVPSSPRFAVSSSCNNQVVLPGASCVVNVTYSPTSVTVDSGTIAGGSVSIAVSGSGQSTAKSAITPSQAVIDYGTRSPNEAAQVINLTLSNTGNANLELDSTSFSPSSGGFSTSGCTEVVAPGASCTVATRFKPTGLGYVEATLSFTSKDGSTAQVIVKGEGANRTCALPWGGVLADGDSISAYMTGTVAYGATCPAAITRSCSDGVLSNAGDFGSCVVASPSNCSTPWGTAIAHGDSVEAYASSVASYGTPCNKETRTCNNGVLSGTAAYAACAVASPASCTAPWGVSVSHGSSISAYEANSVPYGSTCNNESRTCNNGTFSGSFEYGTCTVAAPASCTTPWGAVVAHGASILAYKDSASVTSCSSETRTCSNGTLSGTFANGSCSVVTPTYADPVSSYTQCLKSGGQTDCYYALDYGAGFTWGIRWMYQVAKISSGQYAFRGFNGLPSPLSETSYPTPDIMTCGTTRNIYHSYVGTWLPVTLSCSSSGYTLVINGIGCAKVASDYSRPDTCKAMGNWPAGMTYP